MEETILCILYEYEIIKTRIAVDVEYFMKNAISLFMHVCLLMCQCNQVHVARLSFHVSLPNMATLVLNIGLFPAGCCLYVWFPGSQGYRRFAS